jgi:hypothetical protein
MGLSVTCGIGGTGLVATVPGHSGVRGNEGERAIALRAE